MRIINKVVVMCLSLGLSVVILASQSRESICGEEVLVNEAFAGFTDWKSNSRIADFDSDTWNTFRDTVEGDHQAGDTKPWVWGGKSGTVTLNDMATERFKGIKDKDGTTKDSWDGLEFGFDPTDYAILISRDSTLTLSFTVQTAGNYTISFSYGVRGWVRYLRDSETKLLDTSVPAQWYTPLQEVILISPSLHEDVLLRRMSSDVFRPNQYLDLTFNNTGEDSAIYGSIGEATILNRFSKNFDLTPGTYELFFYKSDLGEYHSVNSISTTPSYISNIWIGDSSLDASKTPAYANNKEMKEAYMIFHGFDKLLDIINFWSKYDINSDGSLTLTTDDKLYQDFNDITQNLLSLLESNKIFSVYQYSEVKNMLLEISDHFSNPSVFKLTRKYMIPKFRLTFCMFWEILQDSYIANLYSPFAYNVLGIRCDGALP